jgi:competence protein ComEC
MARNINKIEVFSFKNIYAFKGTNILVIDSAGTYNLPNYNPKIIVLTNSPKINFDRLLQDMKPELVIADGSNYKYIVEQWKESSSNKKVPFHATAEKGAFILKNSNTY